MARRRRISRRISINRPKRRGQIGPARFAPRGSIAAAAPASPPASTPAPQPMPYDAIYTDAVARAQRNFAQTSGALQFEENDLNRGYNDPTNPFNQLAMAKRAFEHQKSFATNSMAARGQLYSGALQNNLNEGRFQHERQNDSLAQAYQRAKQDIINRRSSAQASLDDRKADAYANRFARMGA